ncbi:polysaccharide deacetylase family protein [Streptomyces sp. FH025]|nr:polysaccharide deacetylase family protein [Streptomyces sp. FH025]MBO1415658.1 polysaccharide deacetylase family protein [Streptomyces sp. FH025]
MVAGCAGPTHPRTTTATSAGPGAGSAVAVAAESDAADRGAARAPAVPELVPGLARQEEENGGEARQEAAARAELDAARRWGLERPPLKAPPRPATRPVLTPVQGVKLKDGRPPVVFRVPTTDKVVFLTIDDGYEKDPEFARMAEELGIPFSAFLSDYLVRDDYDYFRDLHKHGVEINNHTINHRNLKVLDYETQRQEICNQQDQLERQIGVRPRLFRPPYGEYNDNTLRAAGSCGVQAVPLWNEEAFPDHLEWRYDDRKLHPGDIILTHFRGVAEWKATMPDLLRRVVNEVTAAGFALARLDDYL